MVRSNGAFRSLVVLDRDHSSWIMSKIDDFHLSLIDNNRITFIKLLDINYVLTLSQRNAPHFSLKPLLASSTMESIVLKKFDKLPKNGKCARNGKKQQCAILAGFIVKSDEAEECIALGSLSIEHLSHFND
jgi:hypothetical protein